MGKIDMLGNVKELLDHSYDSCRDQVEKKELSR